MTRPPGQPPTVLTIAGSDSSGGAGVQADLATLLACRVHGMSAITAVTVQNSLGVTGYHAIPAAIVEAQIEAVSSDIGVDAAKTGMLASAEIMTVVVETVARLAISPFVVDPVAASQHGDPLFPAAALAVLRDTVVPAADLVTPNLDEVRLLTGLEVTTPHRMREAARKLHDLGPRWVLVKGGRLPGGDALDVLYDGRDFIEYHAPRHDTVHVHGSGDTLASATTAALTRGLAMPEAVAAAKAFVTRSVADSFPLGAGRGPVGRFWRIPDWPPS